MSDAAAPTALCAVRRLAEGRIDEALREFDDSVVMTSYAPVDIFPYLGRKQGKAAVAATMNAVHADFEYLAYQPVFMVTEAEDAAVIVLARLRQRTTDRTIQLFIADFSASTKAASSNCANSWIPSTPCSRCSGARFPFRKSRIRAGAGGEQ